MMVNHGVTTVREFMFCIWPRIRMERLFLQIIKKKLTSVDKFFSLDYHKTLNSPFFIPSLKFQKNLLPPTLLTCPVWNPVPPPFSKEIRGREETMWDTANFRVLQPEWAQPFMTTSTLIFFNQFLILMNLYQHAKNQVFLSFCSAILLTGHEHVGLYLWNQTFHKYEICSRI